MIRHHPVLTVLTLGYLGFVGWVTLGPQPLDAGSSPWLWRALRFFARHEQTAWLDYGTVEFLANVAMFVPIGVFLVLLFGRRLWWLAVLGGVAATCAIEFAQRFLPDRVSDPRDLVANSAGALIGVVAALIVTWPAAVRRRRAARTRLPAYSG